jgi:hypothetical protein
MTTRRHAVARARVHHHVVSGRVATAMVFSRVAGQDGLAAQGSQQEQRCADEAEVNVSSVYCSAGKSIHGAPPLL